MKLGEFIDADWARLCEASGASRTSRRFSDCFSPRFAPVVCVRVAQRLHARGWPRIAKLVTLAAFVLFGLEFPARLEIGPGLVLPHTQGTILGAGRIGRNVTIYQQVTLGARLADYDYDPATRPIVEDGVTITAGAKILGALTLGEGSIIGANAVVLESVPAHATAVGVPARIIQADTANEALR